MLLMGVHNQFITAVVQYNAVPSVIDYLVLANGHSSSDHSFFILINLIA